MEEPAVVAPLIFLLSLFFMGRGIYLLFRPERHLQRKRLRLAQRGKDGVLRTRLTGAVIGGAAGSLLYLSGAQIGVVGPSDCGSSNDSALREVVAGSAADYIKKESLVNLAVVAIADGNAEIVCFGRRSLTSATLVDEDTLFQIGSVTKTFTGLLLALQVEAGSVVLDTPVARLLPQSVVVPGKTRESITLRHLASHTSGLRGVPLASSTAEEFFASLASTELESEPGSKGVYSNMGAALLGYALSHGKGSYSDAVRTAILEPLGMRSTGTRMDEPVEGGLARGYRSSFRIGPLVLARRAEPSGYAAEPFHGMGELRSTPADMLKFLHANMAYESGPLHKAVRLSHRETFRSAESGRIGMFWLIAGEQGTIWHNGQVPGFHAFIGFTTDRRFGVVALTATRRPLWSLGFSLLRQMRQQAHAVRNRGEVGAPASGAGEKDSARPGGQLSRALAPIPSYP